MQRAVELAKRGWYSTSPNPRVGCVIARGELCVGEGWHERAGQAHAEVMALAAAGGQARGATAYVTLEPCCHQGRTAPCSQALINAGVSRVVCGMLDPNPLVAGKGVAQLQAAGLEVQVGILEAESRALNPGYIKRQVQGLPRVRCKMAMSLDGRTAMANGESQWITGVQARRDVQSLRAESCAVLSGAATVVADNARLTVREAELGEPLWQELRGRQPLRVILDRNGKCPTDAPIFQEAGPVLWIVGSNAIINTDWQQQKNLDILQQPTPRPDLESVMRALAERACNDVLVEAGPTLGGALLRAGLLDELTVYLAPKLMGSDARPLFELPLEHLADSIELDVKDIRPVGEDFRLDARLKKTQE